MTGSEGIPDGGLQREFGEQPLARILAERGLRPHDLVAAAPSPITHKMVARACKGRRLTLNTQTKVLAALNKALGASLALSDLFTYEA